MVVISVPSAWAASMVQLLTASPLTWSVQAPQTGRVAADVGAGQPEAVPDVVDEQRAVLDLALVRGAVDRDLDPQDGSPPCESPLKLVRASSCPIQRDLWNCGRRNPATAPGRRHVPLTSWAMRVERAELIVVDMPLVRPFRTAHGVSSVERKLLVRIHTDVGPGWGECAAMAEPLVLERVRGRRPPRAHDPPAAPPRLGRRGLRRGGRARWRPSRATAWPRRRSSWRCSTRGAGVRAVAGGAPRVDRADGARRAWRWASRTRSRSCSTWSAATWPRATSG